MSMEFDQSLEAVTRQSFVQAPFAHMVDIEVLENLRIGTRKVGQSFYKDYVRAPLQERGYSVVGTITLSGGAKGKVLGDIQSAVNQDLLLDKEFSGRRLEAKSITFAQAIQVARLPFMAENFPELHIPSGIPQGKYTPSTYSKFSPIMYMAARKYLARNLDRDEEGTYRSRDRNILLLVESSAHTSAPIPPVQTPPVSFAGIDRGNMGLVNLAVDPITHPVTSIIAVVRSAQLREWVTSYRAKYDPADPGSVEVFRAVKHQFTDKDGEKVDVSTLPHTQQIELVRYLADSTAPPRAIERSDNEFKDLVNKLYDMYANTPYKLSSNTDISYYGFLRKVLKVPVVVVRNDYIEGNRTYNMDHLFRNSLLAAMHPEILPPFIREMMPQEMFEEGEMYRRSPINRKMLKIRRINL